MAVTPTYSGGAVTYSGSPDPYLEAPREDNQIVSTSFADWSAKTSGTLVLPVTKTADFTVADTDTDIIVNNSGGSTTVTLPSAASWPGREIVLRTIQNQTVVSAASNVIPLAGGSAGTAILSGTAGKWAMLMSNGTNWLIHTAG